ncbi:M23 family metallopeptidase [Vibrio parahaemolyticus]|uniref:M23 family metallopeptidase n=1 Tax=Vibrio sp. Vb0888 TaxID=3074632 RepID=UPI0023ECFB70|nr:peptidoglycan DD-metalloendopeptidase family protein [Vibrio sp. Vb0888]EHR0227317.1 M23 family metallopeptidase [Vibrio parahaemolyticus]EJG0997838.1 M23 family metallopeptidase [Vibrio parahaemolyticus]MBE4018880.1 M23 family metallopeptidase [Vibrio parahaemolyticus]MDF4276009.1 peptidoglycan DD-metalloendopeptidase family protein [Vibrio parahaemolyticus]MDF5051023.1 peptidoglycan DD-metalloendopeptidase family protein [Vibrio parahaemolyticus]
MSKIDETSVDESVVDLYPQNLTDEDIIEFLSSGEAHNHLEEIDGYEDKLSDTDDLELKTAGYNARYRGWYGTKNKPRWCPQQSKFNGRGGNHKGVDLAALSGTRLVALVNGSIQWNPKGSGGKWGNHIFLNFRSGRNNYTFVYAHLGGLVGSGNRKVKKGEVICTSGCSGNTTYCGTANKCGKKEDHVHLELFGPEGRMDPVAALGWNVEYSNDIRCIYPSC